MLATLGPLSRKVFPEASRIPLLTSHWPVLGHMATCHSKRGWESIPLLLFSGGRNQRLEMAVGSARWQRLPQSMRAKDFPSDGPVFFQLGNEIICSKSNGTFENDNNVNTAFGALEKLRTDHF